MNSYRFIIASSMDKIFSNQAPEPAETLPEAFLCETVSFQVAYYLDCSGDELSEDVLYFSVRADGNCETSIRKVCLMPGNLVCSGAHDEDYLSTQAGLYPDLLDNYLPEEGVHGIHKQWRSIWVDLTPSGNCSPGICPVTVEARNRNGSFIWSAKTELNVIGARLPEMHFIHTEMLHADCLADYYRTEPFSPRHWKLLENYIQYAVKHGINMAFTPLFTPPLDTAVGGERTTVQLIGVKKTGDVYSFDFTKLDKWVEMCLRCGIRYFEMAPLFTQWGAYYAPKIIADTDTGTKKIFGWDTPAGGKSYRAFLDAFLPQLRSRLVSLGILQSCRFHVSDEPGKEHMESYKAARQCMARHLPDSFLFDACSDYALFREGAVSHPIVSNNHLEPFLDAGVPDLWTYYCCVQGVDVSNRFFAMPSYRNRIIGVQAYLYRLQGFLHWGYNFYNTRYSKKHIDPYAITDCGESFPAGDAFLVYPGDDDMPRGSIRLSVLAQAMNDLRAMQFLESLTSYRYVSELINRQAGMLITFKQYPRSKEFLTRLRCCINSEIYRHLQKI